MSKFSLGLSLSFFHQFSYRFRPSIFIVVDEFPRLETETMTCSSPLGFTPTNGINSLLVETVRLSRGLLSTHRRISRKRAPVATIAAYIATQFPQTLLMPLVFINKGGQTQRTGTFFIGSGESLHREIRWDSIQKFSVCWRLGMKVGEPVSLTSGSVSSAPRPFIRPRTLSMMFLSLPNRRSMNSKSSQVYPGCVRIFRRFKWFGTDATSL